MAPKRIGQMGQTANWHQARHRFRLVVPGESPETLASELDAYLSESPTFWPGATRQSSLRDAPVAFVFSGNGALWEGVAQHMFRRDKVFADSFKATSAAFRDVGFPDLTAQLFDADIPNHFALASVAQPLTFAIQIALVDALAHAGVVPSAVMGHSLGEYAAAVTAGRVSLPDAVKLIATRCGVAEQVRGTGTMAAVAASRETVDALMKSLSLPIDIAAENTVDSVTISGPEEALEAFRLAARKQQVAVRVLAIAYPYHSSALDPLEDRLRCGPDRHDEHNSDVAFYSGWRGARYAGDLDGDYWWHNSRDPVAFRAGCAALGADGYRVVVEISPRTVLANYLRANFATLNDESHVVVSLDSTNATKRSAASIARAVLSAGGAVREDAVLGRWQRMKVTVPSYPFDRKHFRLESAAQTDVLAHRPFHPLLGAKLRQDLPEWRGSLSLDRHAWLGDHKVGAQVILPAMAVVEILTRAAQETLITSHVSLRDVKFVRPLELPDVGEVGIRVTYQDHARLLRLEAGSAENWGLVASARVFAGSDAPLARISIIAKDPVPANFYAQLATRGLTYGASFALCQAYSTDGAVTDIRLKDKPMLDGLCFDPALADAALHAIAIALQHATPPTSLAHVPTRVDRVEFTTSGVIAGARLVQIPSSSGRLVFDVTLLDEAGACLFKLHALELSPIETTTAKPALVWEEILIPLAPQPTGDLQAVLQPRTQADESASDRDVIRSALAGRLAWDAVADAISDEKRLDPDDAA
ncbi:MAG: acyltransferase domain-containing protein, partial [Deltaproteobacteria bacterium]